MADIEWKCVVCGFAIADGDGWLQADMSEVMDYEDAVVAWGAKYPDTGHTMAELSEHPDRVPWRALHSVCDPRGGEPYTIGVEDVRTPWGLVKWSAHLLEKTWLPSTNWDDVLQKKYGEAGLT